MIKGLCLRSKEKEGESDILRRRLEFVGGWGILKGEGHILSRGKL